MPGKKRSGAEGPKRKKQIENAPKKSSKLLAWFLKSAKTTEEAEAANSVFSELDDGSY